MNSIVIIDYGMGNLKSVQKGFEKVGHRALVSNSPDDIRKAGAVVLPGVGSFRDCMRNLQTGGLVEPILEVINTGKPFLGICLGLQLLFTESEEFGFHKGLGVIGGRIRRFPKDLQEQSDTSSETLKVPHMGWNSVTFKKNAEIFKDINNGDYFYFVHSYYVETKTKDVILTTTQYGFEFTSAICRENLYGVQFHPEKSQKSGLKIFKKFGDLAGKS